MSLKVEKTVYPALLVALAIALPTQAAEETKTEKVEAPEATVEITPAEEKVHETAPKQDDKAKKKVKTKLPIGKTDTVITVGDLHCKTCAKRIAGKLYTVKGVVKVRTDVKADVAIVTPQKKKKLSVKDLWVAAQKSGFQPVLLEGPAGKYEPDPKSKAPKLVPKPEKPATEKVAKKPAA